MEAMFTTFPYWLSRCSGHYTIEVPQLHPLADSDIAP